MSVICHTWKIKFIKVSPFFILIIRIEIVNNQVVKRHLFLLLDLYVVDCFIARVAKFRLVSYLLR